MYDSHANDKGTESIFAHDQKCSLTLHYEPSIVVKLAFNVGI